MQAAFANQDIIHEILNQMEICASWKDVVLLRRQRQHLLWAACTCRALLDPALDLLWRRIDSLTPLFKLLSGFVWTGDCYVLLGTLPSGELTRFKRYAVCVREIKIGTSHRIHPSVLHRLWHLQQSPILPRLRFFTSDNADPAVLQPFFFITKTLSHVDIKSFTRAEDPKENYALAAFLDVLADQVHSLRHLRLSGRLPRYCLRSLARIKDLDSLEMSGCILMDGVSQWIAAGLPLPPKAHAPFQRLSSLNISADCLYSILNDQPDIPQMDCLANLTLSGDLSLGLTVLNSLTATRLLSLDVQFQLGKVEEFSTFFSTLPTCFPHLRCLNAHMPTVQWWLPIQIIEFDKIFEPLRALKDMEEFALTTVDVVLLMDDEDIESLASSWPKLRCFSSNHGMHDEWRAPTIHCLAAFARLCPALEQLELPIRLSLHLLPSNTRPLQSLKLICILHQPGEYIDVWRIAHILDSLFPALDLLSMAKRDMSSATWREVIRTMIEIRASRTSLQASNNGAQFETLFPYSPGTA